jgi:histone-lysine N-methyltransferase SETMAR
MSMLKEGRTNVKDDPHTGRQISATSEKDINTLKVIVDKDARCTVEEISDISGLSAPYVFSILNKKLKLKKVCARWIPHLLTSDQKRERLKKPRLITPLQRTQGPGCA